MHYSIIIQFDTSDNIYVASIPELQGCMAHGKTPEEAVREVLIVRDMWIDTAKELGIDIPSPTHFEHPAIF